MKLTGVLVILCVLVFVAGIFVWLYSTLQERARAHYRAMIAAAGLYKLSFADDTDPTIRLRMRGEIEGIRVTLFSRTVPGARFSEQTTQVTAERPKGLSKGGTIIRAGMSRKLRTEGENTAAFDELLKDREVRRTMESVTEPLWSGTNGLGLLDDDGIHLIKGGHIGDEQILSEMLRRAVSAVKALENAST